MVCQEAAKASMPIQPSKANTLSAAEPDNVYLVKWAALLYLRNVYRCVHSRGMGTDRGHVPAAHSLQDDCYVQDVEGPSNTLV